MLPPKPMHYAYTGNRGRGKSKERAVSVAGSILSFLAVLWLWPATVQAQSPALIEAHERAVQLYAQGRYQDAIPFAEKALKLGERELGRDHPELAASLNNLAALYRAQGRYAEAALGAGGAETNSSNMVATRLWNSFLVIFRLLGYFRYDRARTCA